MMSTYWSRALLSLLTAALALAATFPDYTTVSGSAAYTTKIDDVWSQTCVEDAYCVFEAISAKNISTAIGILRQTNTIFAVRSGGHMPNPGANSISNGVLISTSSLNTLKLSANHDVVHIGPGLRWYDVYI
ncbi:FAD binding domain protein [Penicillium atrosanguineum]|nr:FAD binding domain protein [Penicillium atrosanguineum]